MRVLLACDLQLKYTARLAHALAGEGAEVTVLSRTHGWEFGGEPATMRAWVGAALDGRAAHARIPGRVRDVSALRAVVAGRRAVRRFSADVVHLQAEIASDPRLLVVAGLRPRRYALTIHDPTPHPGDHRPGPAQRAVKRALRRGAGLVFVHGEALRDELQRVSGLTAPIEVVPHGATAADAPPLPDEPALLFFGRMSYYKGLDVLLDAMPRVWDRLPSTRLVVAGSGPVAPHHALSDSRVIVRNEHVPESRLRELFAASTCVVLPYRHASQSGVGSLAKQYGRPIVATSLGGLPELVGEAGRVVPPEDPEALAAALVEVLAVPGLAAELGRVAAASVASEASWQRVARATLAAYSRHLSL